MSKQRTVKVAPFDAADYLDSEETIAEFLAIAAEDETPGVFMRAVEAVAKARGMAQVAQASGLSRESLYKALSPGAQPRFETVRRVLNALGAEVAIVPRRGGSLLPGGGSAISPRAHSLASGTVFTKRIPKGARDTQRVSGSRSVAGVSHRIKPPRVARRAGK